MTIFPMDDKVVVITGGNSGIGLETAVGLASAGARVVLGCRNQAKADDAVRDIRTRSGNDAVESRSLDLADLASVRSFAAGLTDLDRIDVLVNNAGLDPGPPHRDGPGLRGAPSGPTTWATSCSPASCWTEVRAAPAGRVVCVASVAHAAAVGGMTWGDLGRRRRYSTVARLRRVQAGQHPPRPGPGPAAGGQRRRRALAAPGQRPHQLRRRGRHGRRHVPASSAWATTS